MRKVKKLSFSMRVIGICFAMMLAILSPITVFAAGSTNSLKISFRNGNSNGQGCVKYSLDGEHWEEVTSYKVIQNITLTGDNLKIKIEPIPGYSVDFTRMELIEGNTRIALNDQNNSNITSALTSEGGYSVNASATSVKLNNVEFKTSSGPGEPGPELKRFKYDFRLNGVDFTDVEDGKNITVPEDFNMDKIEEFYIKKIVVTEGSRTETYTYNNDEYSYSLLDDQGRTILETHFDKISNNYATLRVQSHANDIQAKDIPAGKTKEDFCDFYITNLGFAKSNFRGVEASTSVMPDIYDFTQWNGVDLSGTTKANPGKVTTYYGEDTICFGSIVDSDVKKINLVSNSGVPSNAVDINDDDKTVTVLSNYYNEIPLEIELEDGKKGYVTVDRIGIFVGRLNDGEKTFYHGASRVVGENMNVDTDKNRIVAVFYHEDTKTYNDYDLIVNMVFKDGSTKTATAKGVGDVANEEGNIVGSDYILWSGDREDEPVEVYVTAVSKGALSNSNTFGGATFGSGAGVKWINE